MEKEKTNLHSFATKYSKCFMKVVGRNKKRAKQSSLTPYISKYNKFFKFIFVPFPQTRTLTGLSYIPLYFYGCKGKLF